MNQLQIDFYNQINRLFDNKLPPHVRAIKIEADISKPVCITVEYYPETISGDLSIKKFGLIEHPYESYDE